MIDAAPLSSLQRQFAEPVNNASLAIFRVLYGLLMAFGCARFMWSGWIIECYAKPSFFFKYPFFEWIQVWPVWGMYCHYSLLIVFALCIAAGFKTRWAIPAFTLGFAWVQLMDVTNYLNHYYLVVLIGFLMSFMPLQNRWSIDAWLNPEIQSTTAPKWCLLTLKLQFATVYFFAGLAKLNADWLLSGQPLGIWLASRDEMPIVGQFYHMTFVVYFMSWAGFVYDCTIPLWLSIKKTRLPAFAVVICFHAMTALLFQIGLFPYIMSFGATLFFAPNWPEILSQRIRGNAIDSEPSVVEAGSKKAKASLLLLTALAIYFAFQWTVPLRHYFSQGDVLWSELGMRWSWKVMVREKNGSITYRLRRRKPLKPGAKRHEWYVNALDYLQWRQYKEMSGQPDLIWQLAQHIAADYKNKGLDVEVRVDALVSLNGRKNTHLVDPEVDLTKVPDPWFSAPWITPAPQDKPLKAGRSRR